MKRSSWASGSGIGALVLDGVLGGDDHERRVDGVGDVVDGGLALLHAFEQAGLGLGRGPVDLVGQHDVGEDGAGTELELPALLVEDADAGDVAGEQVGRELHPREAAVDGAGQRLGEKGLADTGKVLDDDMAAGQERDHAGADDLLLAQDDGADAGGDASGPAGDLLHLVVLEDRGRGNLKVGVGLEAGRRSGGRTRLGSAGP